MWFWPKTAQKRKLRIVVLPDVDFMISQKSPNLDHLTSVFEQFLAKPHLVARQNVTFWTFGKSMSGYLHTYFIKLTNFYTHIQNLINLGESEPVQQQGLC